MEEEEMGEVGWLKWRGAGDIGSLEVSQKPQNWANKILVLRNTWFTI